MEKQDIKDLERILLKYDIVSLIVTKKEDGTSEVDIEHRNF